MTRRQALREQLQQFLRDGTPRMTFPTTLNSFERRLIHEVCEELGIMHASTGEGAQRTAHVWRADVPQFEAPEAASPEPDADAEPDAAPVPATTGAYDQLPLDPDGGATQVVPAAAAAPETPPSAKASDPQAAAAEPEAGGILCKFCNRRVPEGNFDIHELRCERLQRKEAQRQTQELKEQEVAKQQHQQQQRANKRLKKDMAGKTDDQVLDELSAAANQCHAARCKQPVSVVGCVCKHCRWKFCMTHMLPEEHGCGAAARRQPGTTPPGPKPPPASRTQQIKHDQLQRKLQKTLEEKAADRAKKSAPSKKKKK